MKDLYDITKKLAGKRAKQERPVKDKTVKQLKGEIEKRRRLKEHFEELLNSPTPPNPPDVTPTDEDLNILSSLKTQSQLKNGKSTEPDNIPAGTLKADLDSLVSILYPLFQKMWEEETIQEGWKEGYLIKLPKKGNLSNCNNYRGIRLLNVPGKIFNRIILSRIK